MSDTKVQVTYCPPGRAAGCTFDPWQFYFGKDHYRLKYGFNGNSYRDGYKPDADSQGPRVKSVKNYSKVTPKVKKAHPWRKRSYKDEMRED